VDYARAIRRPLPTSVLPPTENRAWVDKSRPIRRPLPPSPNICVTSNRKSSLGQI
jgi:hypothetical protein